MTLPVRDLRRAVLAWASRTDRPMPWRGERDPYRVLVSEVMLQQTQAVRVAAAYTGFIDRFPDLAALAGAEPAEVLRAWSGLGYNRRALTLWRAARTLYDRGGFPRSARELGSLPGVGPYTSRAVASFAFGADEAPVDANIRRVITRMVGLRPDADVQCIADELLPSGRSSVWNQALIDLGATVCTARAPRCADCPARAWCAWAAGRRVQAPPRRRSPRFADTTRYARGRVLDALRDASRGAGTPALVRTTGLGSERVGDALRSLEAEGLVRRAGRRWALGPQRAQPRSASTSGTR